VIRRMLCGAFLAVLIAAPAQAQVVGQFLGGMTSAASQEIFLAGSLGVGVGVIEINVEGGRMHDILPKGLFNALNQLQEERDLPVRARARLANTYGVASLKLMPSGGAIRPFVSAGAGVAHLEPKFEVTVLGVSLGDVFGATDFEPTNKLMLTAGGGVRIGIGSKSLIDLGYRFVRVDADYSGFNITGVPVNVNTFYVALGARF
jgi:opacity protein-like surface antigen